MENNIFKLKSPQKASRILKIGYLYVFILPFPSYVKFKYNEIYKRYKLGYPFLNFCQNCQGCSMELHKLPYMIGA